MNMDTVHYDVLINCDRYKEDGYQPAHELVLTYSGTVAWGGIASTLDTLYERHNRGDRPDGQTGPALSVGDVVHLCGWGYFEASSGSGWGEVVAPDEIENERTWSEVMAAR